MTRQATIRDIEGALHTLGTYLPGHTFQLERWGQKVRVIKSDQSRPFGANYMTKAQAYETIWFAVNALRLQKEGGHA